MAHDHQPLTRRRLGEDGGLRIDRDPRLVVVRRHPAWVRLPWAHEEITKKEECSLATAHDRGLGAWCVPAESTQRDRWGELQRAVKRARCRCAKEARQTGDVVCGTRAKGSARYGCDLTIGSNDLGVRKGSSAMLVYQPTGMVSV